MAKLLLITSNNILPFTIDNITQCSGDEFLSQNNNEIFKNLKWGDAIQIDSDYRNEDKFFWDNGWHSVDHSEINYGVLPPHFSLLNPEITLPLDYFNEAMYYNLECVPWNPKWFENEWINNIIICGSQLQTHFIRNNKKFTITHHLPENICGNTYLKNFGYSVTCTKSPTTGDYLTCTENNQFICKHNNSPFPESARKYVKKYNDIDIDETNYNILDKCMRNAIIITNKPPKDISDILFFELAPKETIDNEKKKFIDGLLNSKYLFGDISEESDNYYFDY